MVTVRASAGAPAPAKEAPTSVVVIKAKCTLVETTPQSAAVMENGALHQCVRNITRTVFEQQGTGESHPKGVLVLESFDNPHAFVKGEVYTLRLEK